MDMLVRATIGEREPAAIPTALNSRVRDTAHFSADTRPMLLTLIDAEETFDWDAVPFSRTALDVSSMKEQWRAHGIFEKHGVVPTYLVDYAVASQDDGCAPLQELIATGSCDIGTQLHVWVNPPFEEELSLRNSFACNLTESLEFRKTAVLTDLIEARLGVRPQIFRSGRFGAGPRTPAILSRLEYLADSSVMPGWSFAAEGGPDYIAAPTAPFWLDSERRLLEIPSSAGFVGRLSAAWAGLPRLFVSQFSERLRFPGLSSRLGLLERIRLTPEGVSCAEAKKLVRHMLHQGKKVFNLTYHSPSLKPGCTHYVRTEQDVLRFLDWLDEFYTFFTQEINGDLVTWRQVRDRAAARNA